MSDDITKTLTRHRKHLYKKSPYDGAWQALARFPGPFNLVQCFRVYLPLNR